jgi:recombinational DNA repair protein (RecF pathway)
VASIALIEVAPPEALPVVGLRSLWRLIADLGLAPEVDGCARDGAPLPLGTIGFSHRDGGFLCEACARGGVATRLPPADREALVELLRTGADLPILSPRHVAAHRRLLVRWVQTHLGDVALPALETWQRDSG